MNMMTYEERCSALRQDLKAWEKKFAAQNNGRKAGRDDIKADAEISQKYKEYNKLRARPSSAPAPRTPSKRNLKSAPTPSVVPAPETTSKDLTTTPMKRKRTYEQELGDLDVENNFLSPQGPTVIGPTPQRDGIVLGLFDMLPSETPTKKRIVLGDAQLNVPQTPSRTFEDTASQVSLESRARGEKTPLSAGKRFLLNQFVTPKKRKMDEEGTPSSTLRGLATPAFLRRDNVLNVIDEEDETTTRVAPWKRRGLGRSLSAMIQAMRQDEDDRLDEEADIMRELEMEQEGLSIPKKPTVSHVLVEDSQVPMPLGPDRGSVSDDEGEEEPELGLDGKPRRVWKKKGLKRQTRRVIMRPRIAKAKPQEILQREEESKRADTGEAEAEDGSRGVVDDDNDDDDDDDDDDVDDDQSDYASDASHSTKKIQALPKKSGEKKTTKENGGEGGVVRSAARKIKATANANYCRLKIKGKGAIGGRGRFGRKR